jgi:hypothetical protein
MGIPWSYNSHNDLQGEIVYNVFNGYDTMYLEDYEYIENMETPKLRIKLFGNLKNKKKRESYTVSIDTIMTAEFTIGSRLTCDCKDFKYRGEKCDIVCKHIVFILCKVCGIFTNEYFTSKKLSGHHTDYVSRLLRSDAVWRNRNISIKYLNEDYDTLLKCDDNCMICLEELVKDDTHVKCQTCNVIIHKDCMETWLNVSGFYTCIKCRCDWGDYILFNT